jgi:hypothetical protein
MTAYKMLVEHSRSCEHNKTVLDIKAPEIRNGVFWFWPCGKGIALLSVH